ncbi:MAG: hypothetical protein F6K36_02635 [Symploca sp. SIO3C6]|nr:hypothetical protein [Symploca sp. SIO3C6]
MSLKTSDQGLEVIDALRRKKGWCKSAITWADYANVAQSTLKRFWRKEPILEENFKAICQAVGVQNWQDIIDYQQSPSLPEEISEVSHYINRPPVETSCFQEILQPGALIRIKAPRKMGKTRLMQKIFAHAQDHNYQTVTLNLLWVEASVLTDLNKFLRCLCHRISRRLKLKNQVSEIWDPDTSSNDNCTAFLEECILSQLDTPLVLGLDNVDWIFQHPAVASDFFRLLRSWHDEAKSYDLLKNLRLIVVHSTEVYIPLNINHSPFNVGLSIGLPEFTPQQVLSFAQRYGLDWQSPQVEQLMALIGGHPYLIQQALEAIKRYPNLCLQQLLDSASTASSIYRNHLRALWEYLQQDSELIAAMEKVVTSDHAIQLSADQAFKLHSMGLVQWQGDEVESSCRLYHLYFRNQLRGIQVLSS